MERTDAQSANGKARGRMVTQQHHLNSAGMLHGDAILAPDIPAEAKMNKLLSVVEAADLLRLKPATIYKYRLQGTIPGDEAIPSASKLRRHGAEGVRIFLAAYEKHK